MLGFKRRTADLDAGEQIARTFLELSDRLAHELPQHAEYCRLQTTWNEPILRHLARHLPGLSGSCLCLGSFFGAFEMSLASHFERVVAVDHECFLPDWRSSNVVFHRANLDTGDWQLPEGPFALCTMIEVLEHLLWSPVPLLKWIQRNCGLFVVTTPDNDDWPPLPPKPYMRYSHFSAIPSAVPGSVPNPEPMFHCKQYSQGEFIELLGFCGFRVLEMQRVGKGGPQLLAIAQPRR
jgi:hypothetical protein